MTERSRSMAQPPDAILAECLSDAIKVSGCTTASESNNLVNEGMLAAPEHDPSQEKIDLALSLRDLVSERIANRLSSDPDFDPNQFPLSHEAFLRKHSDKP
ncbi:unnamed protein product [Echinostoma caproni]|uniref:Type II toxin-antitoxin system ParD family antitoxin n=1 Tax=Echinostoma caproni TaxID=27848 RepID=A0A183A1X5_9TREM|nr:unnamed protein product [Echinostoma caproni]